MNEKDISAAILVGIAERGSELEECSRSLDELERLLDTAGGTAFAKVMQVKESFDPRTCIGKGKVEEIRELCQANDVHLVIFDFELTAAQIRNIESDIDGIATVIDRSMLILDIFALHATSGEGKLQVELAQLRYSAPRIMGKGSELSRQGGGIGSRGPGESKLETDRRHLHERIHTLESRLAEMEHNRSVMRQQRDRSGLAKLALVGYTNAGKSTLLNALTDAGVLSMDKLFATLDPTTRKMVLPSGESVLLTDTVGFIRKLPHHLVKAFRSTLDEVKYADILLVVCDISDPEVAAQIAVTTEVIEELGGSGKPIIYVYNKCDRDGVKYAIPKENTVILSAKTGEGIDALLSTIERVIQEQKKDVVLAVPYNAQYIVSELYNTANVKNVEYLDEHIRVSVMLDEKAYGQYKRYIIDGE